MADNAHPAKPHAERGGDTVTGSPYRIRVVDVRSGALTRLTGHRGQHGPAQGGAWEDFDPLASVAAATAPCRFGAR
ncbi:hypothetical protein ACIRP7_14185 [Streptomyces sp. NPDC102270]|uniref:hypothetical protein n=1 Tax=Streptomyces sp. NPDC102270 TaxID=3366150 RepID=UPI00382807F0